MRRKRNHLVIFVAEGRNETEKLYLRDLIQDNDGFTLKKAYGSATDPEGMVKNLINTMKDFDFDAKKILPLIDCGDNDFIVFHIGTNKWSRFNIVDECIFKERDSLEDVL